MIKTEIFSAPDKEKIIILVHDEERDVTGLYYAERCYDTSSGKKRPLGCRLFCVSNDVHTDIQDEVTSGNVLDDDSERYISGFASIEAEVRNHWVQNKE